MKSKILYHGSGFKHSELKPGIQHSGVKVEWDKTESNEYLYADEIKENAISMAFASAIEKKYELDRYQTKKDSIKIKLANGSKVPTKEMLANLKIYLYTIALKETDQWEKVNNKVNDCYTEYKTNAVIKSHILNVQEVDLEKWLGTKKLSISNESLTSLNW
jgi:hypothetical protein